MDFKSLMAAQIAKAKPPKSPSPAQSSPSPTPADTTTTTTTTTTSKYLRRAELEAARAAAYAAEQARIEAERQERAAKKRKLEEEEEERKAKREEKRRRLAEESRRRREEQEREEERKRRKRLGLPELPPDSQTTSSTSEEAEANGTDTNQPDMPDDELRQKLRELNEPATLYDETHAARLQRYRKLTEKSVVSKAKAKLYDGPIPTTLEPVPEKDMLLPTTVPAKDTPEHDFLYRQLASWFTLVLTEWSIALAQREAAVRASTSGKAAFNNYQVVLKDLTPLFRHFERRDLDPGLLEPICQIVRAAQRRRYVEANDAYLTLSIGKAAWPIGVTMVGIHERSAREKLHESSSAKQAHILADEVTRKFLQSIKRCLSFAQTRWPPEDLAQLMG